MSRSRPCADAIQPPALHVTRVTSDIDASRGLVEGSIVAAHAPLEVRAGQTVRVRLRVIYRGPLKTVSFRLRIPSGAKGPLLATIHGPASTSSSPSSSLTDQLTAALSGSSPEESDSSDITSLADLRASLAGIATYDGLFASFQGTPSAARTARRC